MLVPAPANTKTAGKTTTATSTRHRTGRQQQHVDADDAEANNKAVDTIVGLDSVGIMGVVALCCCCCLCCAVCGFFFGRALVVTLRTPPHSPLSLHSAANNSTASFVACPSLHDAAPPVSANRSLCRSLERFEQQTAAVRQWHASLTPLIALASSSQLSCAARRDMALDVVAATLQQRAPNADAERCLAALGNWRHALLSMMRAHVTPTTPPTSNNATVCAQPARTLLAALTLRRT